MDKIRMGEKLKDFIKFCFIIFGYAFGLSNSTVLFLTFITAYFNGNQCLVVINNYGEANIEMVLLLFTMFVIYAGFIIIMLRKEK